MRTAIDSNIFSALWGGEPSAHEIAGILSAAKGMGGLAVSPVTYVELRAHPRATGSFVEEALEEMNVDIDWELDQAVWQLAANRFEQYGLRRRRGGSGEPKRFIADFLIGAHALLRANRLLTLDVRRYRADYPDLKLAEL
jgi:hypothetical protein